MTKEQLIEKFENGDTPTGDDYKALIESIFAAKSGANLTSFENNVPKQIGVFGSKKLYRIITSVLHPSSNVRTSTAISKAAEILSYQTQVYTGLNTLDGKIKIIFEKIKVGTDYNIQINSIKYTNNSTEVDLKSFSGELVDTSDRTNTYSFNWTGTKLVIETLYNKATTFEINAKRIELTTGKFVIGEGYYEGITADLTVGTVEGVVNYSTNAVVNAAYNPKKAQVSIISGPVNYELFTSKLNARDYKLFFTCEFLSD